MTLDARLGRVPQIEQHGTLHFAGLSCTIRAVPVAEVLRADEPVAALWQQLAQSEARPQGIITDAHYGVVLPRPTGSPSSGKELGYLAAWQVQDAGNVGASFTTLSLDPSTYAKFSHFGPLRELTRTVHFAFQSWLPNSGFTLRRGHPALEVYDQRFAPKDPDSVMEYWIPVAGGA